MELIGQQWMGSFSGTRGILSGSARSLSKVEIFIDPRIYDGSKVKFEDWWTKMKAWLNYNPKQFAYIDADRDEIINGKNCAYVILSYLCSLKSSHFTEVKLQKLADRDTQLHNWDMLVKEVEELFHPQLQVNQIKNKISWFSQGDLDINTFITKWQLLYHQSKINATMGMWLLKNEVSPCIYFELFHINACKTTVNEILTEIRKIAKAFKAYTLFSWGTTGEPSDKPNAKKHFSKKAEVEDLQGVDNIQINMFRSKKPNAKGMKCFNCGENGHGAKKCWKLKNECPECHFLGEFHKKDYQRNIAAGPSAWSANFAPPATSYNNNHDSSHTIRGMDYKQMKAYFFDLKDTQDWSNGKEKGPANWLIWVVSLLLHYTIPSRPFLLKIV